MKNEVIEVYDKIAGQYAAIFDNDPSDNVAVGKFLNMVRPGGNILDIGCGTGRLTKYYADRGFKVMGIDASQNMLAIAEKNYPELEFDLMDVREMDCEKNTFDAVSAAYSLFHLNKKEAKEIIKKIRFWLKPKGVLFLVLQEGEGEIMVEEPLLPGEKLFLNLYSEPEIRDLLKDNDFIDIKVGRKIPSLEGELPYNKMFIWTQLKF